MIYLEKGQVNSFVLTLTEVTTLPNPYYLFEFEDEFNTAPETYNLFTIDEPTDIDFIKGQYRYKVYQSSIPTLDPTGLTMIEEGRLVVAGITTNSIYD